MQYKKYLPILRYRQEWHDVFLRFPQDEATIIILNLESTIRLLQLVRQYKIRRYGLREPDKKDARKAVIRLTNRYPGADHKNK
ncbi:hypothetical protein SAMN05216325_11142 [Nitrosomonas marina]|uniref:Uncharacterized protein n=1 Tax=Nitrosomonas marina TaxID=917 RepID=A0A1H8EZD4_9PROT|nr:hypothetical protein SAMN05216325_11142 [Nitrosomonas marina]